MTNFNIKIISDNVCPWCYVGKRRLDKAISLYQRTYPAGKDDTFTVTWSPFYLDPTAPNPGIPFRERMAQRFGPGRLEGMKARLTQIGAEEGINFSFDSRVGNTRDSHRVVALAGDKSPETQNKVVAEIMRSYFEEDGDITSRDMLVQAAVKGGLEAGEVKAWLEGEGGGAQVDREVQQAYALGVSGVPHFVIDGQQLGGAQDVEAFVEQFVNIKEKKA
ncbi:hypothetical protein ACHAQA_007768 [Verticillium albo-atrum]